MPLSRYALACAALLLASCGSDTQRGGLDECDRDSDCPSGARCDTSRNVCVQCFADDQCGCHEVCQDNRCQPIGASTAGLSKNAHGNWTGAPGDASYNFQGFCQTDSECGLGQVCNPHTAGCVSFAGLATCGAKKDCAEGFACDPRDGGTNKCFPAALCRSQSNCCGLTGMQCQTSAGMCVLVVPECTPPTATAQCPFAPKVSDECPTGLFCGPLGQCVQCSCDADCPQGSGLTHCYGLTGNCVPDGYCTLPTDCTGNQSCDTRNHLCAPSCTGDNECDSGEYCDQNDHVCRAVDLRPCTPDSFEANNTFVGAGLSGSALPVPAFGAPSLEVSELTLCNDDVDWYAIPVIPGDRIQISSSSSDGVGADLTVYAPDGATEVTSAELGGSSIIDFTANFTGNYWLEVAKDSFSAPGAYALGVAKLVGVACQDTFESTTSDNTPATARLLNPASAAVPAGCTLTGTVGLDHTVTCDNNALRLCVGDVDYYLLESPPGARVRMDVTGTTPDIDLTLYGPFLSGEEVNTERVADSSGDSTSNESVEVLSRTGGRWVLKAARYRGENPRYNLVATVTAGPACTEDAYDAESASPPAFDVSGFNDRTDRVSGLNLTTGTTTLNLTMCRGDLDLFELGTASGGSLAALAAGKELVVELLNIAPGPATSLTLVGGLDLVDVAAEAGYTTQSKQKLAYRPTANAKYYVAVVADDAGSGPYTYDLRITLADAPICSTDVLGDAGAPGNATPANAYALSGGSWPSTVGGSHTQAAVALCLDDDDWYSLTPPASSSAVASIVFDPTVTDMSLALYGSSVTGATITPGTPPTTGLIDLGDVANAGFQWVRGTVSGTGYALVTNFGNWPSSYNLTLTYLASGCPADSFEPNDSGAAAQPLTLLDTADPRVKRAFIGPLTICSQSPGGDDWFKLPAGPGDRIVTSVYSSPDEGSLDYFLREPAPAGVTDSVDYDYGATSGNRDVMSIDYLIPANGVTGDYLLDVRPYSFSGSSTFNNVYFLEAAVVRACVDDAREPSTQASPNLIAMASLPLTNAPLMLCRDQDWYRVDVPASTTVSACIKFTHANGDIDLKAYTNPSAAPVVQSATNADFETLSVTTTGSPTTYYFQVAFDTASAPKNVGYTMSMATGAITCP